MSKSYDNGIPLFAPPERQAALVRRVVTDSRRPGDPKDPDACTLVALLDAFADPAVAHQVRGRYRTGGIGYGDVTRDGILGRMVLPHGDEGRGPAVVLLHAGIGDRRMWSEHVGPLAAAGFRVVAVDLPGFGEAPVPAELAPWRDVVETLDALGLDRAVLAGCSFGGAVALSTAVWAPDRVGGLALVSAPPPFLEPSGELTAVWEAEEAALEAGDVDAAVDAVLAAWVQPDAPAGVRERVAAMQRHALERQIAAPEPDELPDPAESAPDAVARLDVPAWVAVGEHDMEDFLRGAQQIAAALGTEAVVLEGAGHLAPLETPEAFRRGLLEFLAA